MAGFEVITEVHDAVRVLLPAWIAPTIRRHLHMCAALREAFPETDVDQYLIFDRDAKVSTDVHQFLDSSGLSAIHTSYRSPWPNGVAERWVRSFRNDLLDHVIVVNESHLKRLARRR